MKLTELLNVECLLINKIGPLKNDCWEKVVLHAYTEFIGNYCIYYFI